METQDIYLEDYDWSVRFYYDVRKKNSDKIINFMYSQDYMDPIINKVKDSLNHIEPNMGITAINKSERFATIVITHTTSTGEFFNTLLHELKHLIDYIGMIEGIALTGEELAYMIGDIGMMLFPVAGKYLCDCY